MITLSLAAGETWRDALIRLLPSATRHINDALGPLTDNQRAACVDLFDSLVGDGIGSRDAVIIATYRSAIPAVTDV